MSHFDSNHFLNFRESLKRKNCEVFVLVMNKGTGEITMSGNLELAFNHLTETKRAEKRNSREWVPNKPIPKPPKPFEDLVQDQNCLRKYASDLLGFFKDKKQKLGQVSQIKKWDL